MLRIIGSDKVREVPHDLAVPDQEQVVLERDGVDDPVEEGTQMLIAPTIALRLMLRRCVTGGAMTTRDTRVNCHGAEAASLPGMPKWLATGPVAEANRNPRHRSGPAEESSTHHPIRGLD